MAKSAELLPHAAGRLRPAEITLIFVIELLAVVYPADVLLTGFES